ncbi:hypothetical protein BDZ85DRAFT_282578 [Elsinoe ampelina]|uniref:Uncharacterized protein n=1 Tax=Elsinoe ampelina TaxID=302913 RepID=A0A6A6GAW7_9PEZI|nr:hypothetical protein BDZ85DRAFT_282578 [Elsinoe ampelina]
MNSLAQQPIQTHSLIQNPPLPYNHPASQIVQPWAPAYSQIFVPASFSVLPQQGLLTGSQPPDIAGWVQRQILPPAESMPGSRLAMPYSRLTAEEVNRYRPQYAPGWWYMTDVQWFAHTVSIRNNYSRIGLIMETELGKRYTGNEACSNCNEKGWECWSFTPTAVRRIVTNARLRYAHCRGVGNQRVECTRMDICRREFMATDEGPLRSQGGHFGNLRVNLDRPVGGESRDTTAEEEN